jgi:hypothetical protein
VRTAYRTGYLDAKVVCGWCPRGGPWIAYALGYLRGSIGEKYPGW